MRACACLGNVCATCSGHARCHYIHTTVFVLGSACVCEWVWAYMSRSSVFAAFAQHLCRVDVGLAME